MPGHAVLVTGGDTAQHGIPANEWIDRGNNYKSYYCVSDPKMQIVGGSEGAGLSPVSLMLLQQFLAFLDSRQRGFQRIDLDHAASSGSSRKERLVIAEHEMK